MLYYDVMKICNKCFKMEGLENGVICQLLLIKPWEIAKKSQSYIHYYLVIDNFHTTFEDNRCCYHYLLIPTTTKNIKNNKSLLKIDSKNWYNNKNVYLKLDEIFILQDFDFRTWITFGENKVCDWFPRLTIDSFVNDWKLSDKNIWNQISQKLYKNLSNNRIMFFILDRNSFQFNSNYWTKKIRSKYVYNTNCFIPKWNDDLEAYFLEIKNKIDNIRIHKKNKNDIKDIVKYRCNHFDINEDKEKIKKYNEYFKIK